MRTTSLVLVRRSSGGTLAAPFFRRRTIMIVRIALVLAVATMAGVLAPPGSLAAEGGQHSDDLIQRGIELRKEGKDREALTAFQRAARLQETPRVWAQIGAAEQALGLWVDANLHLARALDNKDDAWIAKNRTTLESALDTVRSHLIEVEVWGGPNGAEVQFDGVSAGRLPSVTAWLLTGQVAMAVSAPGHVTVTRPVNVPPTGRGREHVQLRPVATSVAGASGGQSLARARTGGPTMPTSAEGIGSEEAASTGSQATDSSSDPIYRRWWFWTAIGVIAVGAGAGIYFATRDNGACSQPPCDTL